MLTLLAALPLVSGCGGLDQTDMRKYAIKRPSDDDDTPATPRAGDSTNPVDRPGPAPVVSSPPPSAAATAAPPQSKATASQVKATAVSADDRSAASDPLTAAATPPAPARAELSDTLAPNPQLPVEQRRQMTLDHLRRIAQALEAYLLDEDSYPAHAIYSPSGQPLLSWRVRLLPYLGYQELYKQFRTDEPWDNPHNMSLLAQIPSVYQSPDRFDTKTNYLLPCGSTCAFGTRQTKPPRRWEDGAPNTVILVEADDALASPWTQPSDLPFRSATPRVGLGTLRSDGFFAVFGGGRLARIPPELDDRLLRSVFTVDGGETVSAGALGRPALAEVHSDPDAHSLGEPTPTTEAKVASTSSALRAVVSSRPVSGIGVASGRSMRAAREARLAADAGLESEAMRLCYAAYLLAESGSSEWFRWVPGLRRPALGVRWGIGLDFVGSDRKAVERLAVTTLDGKNPWPRQQGELERIVGDVGKSILDVLQSTPRFLPPPLDASTHPRAETKHSASGVTFLGVADESTLWQVARRDLVDCLLLFVVEQRRSRRGSNYQSVSLNVMDVAARRSLYESPKINYLRRERSLADPLYEDPIPLVTAEFEQIITQRLQPEKMPEQLRPEHAARRVAQLGRVPTDCPLGVLSEMRFYQRRKLISLVQLLEGYQAILGASAGLSLLAGESAAKQDAIATWLPTLRLPQNPRHPDGTEKESSFESAAESPVGSPRSR